MKRWLYLVHRWSGVALCLVMAPWFLSGIVMLYVGYPKLTDAERWEGLPALSAEGCCVPLVVALRAAGFDDTAAPTWRLSSVAGVPTYVFSDARRVVAVHALSGARMSTTGREAVLATATHFAGGAPARYVGLVREDAWTHSKALDPHRPMHIVEVDDAQHRWLYVSERTGEVVRDATRVERSWGWLGAWLHWLYIFRGGAVDAWWTDIIITLSLIGTVLALTGMVVGVLRWRFKGRYRSGRHTPYAGFNARWHHVLGMVGGVFAITWVLSGLFSVNPWKIFTAPGARPDTLAYAGGPLAAGKAPEASAVLQALSAQGIAAKEFEWRRVGGEHHVLAHTGTATFVIDSQGLRREGMPETRWREAATRLLPKARIVEDTLLTNYDAYYVAREPHTMGGHRERPLPAWRLRFDDANATTVTIDPRTGSILQIQDSHRRADRWLFAFLHSFDLPVLLASRPLWDIGMIAFSLAGLGLSLTGIVTGWRRVRVKVKALRVASR